MRLEEFNVYILPSGEDSSTIINVYGDYTDRENKMTQAMCLCGLGVMPDLMRECVIVGIREGNFAEQALLYGRSFSTERRFSIRCKKILFFSAQKRQHMRSNNLCFYRLLHKLSSLFDTHNCDNKADWYPIPSCWALERLLTITIFVDKRPSRFWERLVVRTIMA